MAVTDIGNKVYYAETNKMAGTEKNSKKSVVNKTNQDAEKKSVASSDKTTTDKTTTDREAALDVAMQDYYQFVQDRIKNGPEKIRTGASEMTTKEWKTLLEKVDASIDAAKEELRQRIKEQDEQAKRNEIYKKIDAKKELEEEQVQKAEEAQDNFGIVLRQMNMKGESSKTITHNGVTVAFDSKTNADGSFTNHIQVGTEKADSKMYSVMTKNGILTFDLKHPEDMIACLDMLDPEDAINVMTIIQKERMKNSSDLDLNDDVDEMEEKLKENAANESAYESGVTAEVQSTGVTQQQISQLFVDRSNADATVESL